MVGAPEDKNLGNVEALAPMAEEDGSAEALPELPREAFPPLPQEDSADSALHTPGSTALSVIPERPPELIGLSSDDEEVIIISVFGFSQDGAVGCSVGVTATA